MSERISARMRDINVEWLTRAAEVDHLFHNRWLGELFFHLPGDMLAIQELVWRVKPRCIIQTGIAAGGGAVFSASMLELAGGDGIVVAVEPKLRPEVRDRLLSHRLAHRMRIVEGDSLDPATFQKVVAECADISPTMVILDLVHTHEHVLGELRTYAPLVTPGSYAIVMDTIMEHLPVETFAGKPYGRGNNPATAAKAFLIENDHFEVDHDIEDQVIMTLSPDGFLRRAR
ncbi:cephalosporin hydroxylase family protein [Luteibacter flocculans]|uniref:Cephalosporin hydroxylase family protein n=1 Tax=Luteibacter flocculans TaxID=2780091 RepID=A0ABY4T5H3_9GAMM|nr:CmcI family methyltransferase [Luteibacter flocculans]URL60143.1 cephalosporin hydroxylase family protein [Luteibacter flocculans]